MNIEDRTEFWDLIGKIAGDLDQLDWDIIEDTKAGYSKVEIAKRYGIHRDTVADRWTRMRTLLRKIEQVDKIKFGG